jgi:hypothetical protein
MKRDSMSTAHSKSPRKRPKPWWKTHEEVSFLFEKLFRPLEKEILHNTWRRDIVGVLRQLDVGVIDADSGQNRVKAFVEVQKRKTKVNLKDFGNWVYKRNTLQADELIVVSEEGFTKPVLTHAKKENVRLGMLHETESVFIADINSTLLGTTRVWDKWWFASIFVQYEGADEIAAVDFQKIPTMEENIFGEASPIGLIERLVERHRNIPPGNMNIYIITCDDKLSYSGRPIKRVIITAEKQRRIWEPRTQFFAYDEVYPNRLQRGIAVISEFKWDDARVGRLTLVISPDTSHISGRGAHIAGQFELSGG